MKAFTPMMQQQKPAVIEIEIKSVRLEDIIDVRHAVLRQGLPRSSCYYPEDSFKHTIHFAASNKDTIIGCASLYKESHPDFKLKQSWRIRGMAVLEEFQSQAVGRQLLEACINHGITQKADVLWCNARIHAMAFYQREGFKIIGEEFEIPEIGPHFLMAKNLGIHIGKTRFLEIAKRIFSKDKPMTAPQPKIKT